MFGALQELDYEDIPEETAEEFVLEETPDIDIEDPLMVGEQPNDTTCAVESTEVYAVFTSMLKARSIQNVFCVRTFL